MGFFAWKFWRGRRKTKPMLSSWKSKKNPAEKVTPWYGFQPEQVVGQQQTPTTTTTTTTGHEPDRFKADLLPTPSFSGSRSSSNSTVRSLQSHTHHPMTTTMTERPSSSQQNFNSSIHASSSSSPAPPAPIVRSSSVSSHLTTSTASTTLSTYPLTFATYAFNPTREDEMPLAVGMPIRIVAPFDDGWAWVVRDDDADCRGMVPCECLEMYTTPTTTVPDEEEQRTTDDKTLWETVQARKRTEPVPGSSSSSRRMSLMTVTDVSERSSSLNHSYGSSTSTNTSDVLWLNPKRRPLRIQNPDADN